MNFKQFLTLIADPDGFIPTSHLRWVINTNTRSTAREEAIALGRARHEQPVEDVP